MTCASTDIKRVDLVQNRPIKIRKRPVTAFIWLRDIAGPFKKINP